MATAPEIWLVPNYRGRAHKNTNNFAPNEFREVVNLSGLVVYKGSKHKGEIITVRLKGNKAVNKNCVNYGGNMDWGAMTFTSDVSLPKYSKQLC